MARARLQHIPLSRSEPAGGLPAGSCRLVLGNAFILNLILPPALSCFSACRCQLSGRRGSAAARQGGAGGRRRRCSRLARPPSVCHAPMQWRTARGGSGTGVLAHLRARARLAAPIGPGPACGAGSRRRGGPRGGTPAVRVPRGSSRTAARRKPLAFRVCVATSINALHLSIAPVYLYICIHHHMSIYIRGPPAICI